RLYKLVAPLVMRADVLRQNNNYPYKTSDRYEWLVALDDKGKNVQGFFPVEEKKGGYYYLNNYYVPAQEEEALLSVLIDKILEDYAPQKPLVAIAFARHAQLFQEKGFTVEREWKLYVKLKHAKVDGKAS
ncbi:MAG: hypothetical protein LUC18_00620, partial [Porphyromonadaceae bacterium]|nr:hypothetical protein [Porphyromonadaceae bacterium]